MRFFRTMFLISCAACFAGLASSHAEESQPILTAEGGINGNGRAGGKPGEVIDRNRDTSKLDPFDPTPPNPLDTDYELLDFALYGRAFDPTTLVEYLEIIEPRLKELEKKLPNLVTFIRYLFNEGGASWFFVKDPLAKTSVAAQVTKSVEERKTDSGLVLTYQRVQAAVTFPNAFVTLVNKNIWDKLENDENEKDKTEAVESRAFLLLHELLWMAELSPLAYQHFNTLLSADKLEEILPKTTSEKIRTLTGLLLSAGFARKDKFTMSETIIVSAAKLKNVYNWYEDKGKDVITGLPKEVPFSQRTTKLSPLALLAKIDAQGLGTTDSVSGEDLVKEQAELCLAKEGYYDGTWKFLDSKVKYGNELHLFIMRKFSTAPIQHSKANVGVEVRFLKVSGGANCDIKGESKYIGLATVAKESGAAGFNGQEKLVIGGTNFTVASTVEMVINKTTSVGVRYAVTISGDLWQLPDAGQTIDLFFLDVKEIKPGLPPETGSKPDPKPDSKPSQKTSEELAREFGLLIDEEFKSSPRGVEKWFAETNATKEAVKKCEKVMKRVTFNKLGKEQLRVKLSDGSVWGCGVPKVERLVYDFSVSEYFLVTVRITKLN